MPGIFKVKGLEERKCRLVMQSDIYRQMIAGDVRNLQLSVHAFKKKFDWLHRAKTALPLATAALGFLAWRRRRKAAQQFSPAKSVMSFVGKELLRNLLPVGGGFLAKRLFSRRR